MIIGVGTDGSETAQKAVDFAMDMAERYQAKLLIASAYRPVSFRLQTGSVRRYVRPEEATSGVPDPWSARGRR